MTNAIRKAAILISTLDTRAADALLDQMGPQQAARVRHAIMDLGDIPPEEQERVIADFLRGNIGQPQESSSDNGGVELDASLLQRLSEEPLEDNTPTPAQQPTTPQVPFQFLHEFPLTADAAIIAETLRREQPQTIAVVIAHLPPEQAAGVLEKLPAALSIEALERMAWLGEMDAEILAELEQQLKTQLLPRLQAARRQPEKLSGVNAVLSALSSGRRQEALRSLATRDERLTRQLGYLPDSTPSAPHDVPRLPDNIDPPTSVVSFRYPRQEEPTAAAEFEDLTALSDADLKQVFASVDPQVAVLALTDADPRLTRRILLQLPGRKAELLRKALNHPGPLRLRDLEAAQQQLAQVASRLAASGSIRLPPRRRFAAAA